MANQLLQVIFFNFMPSTFRLDLVAVALVLWLELEVFVRRPKEHLTVTKSQRHVSTPTLCRSLT